MTIEDLNDWNTRLGYCGCCLMPACPVPEMVCENVDAVRNSVLYFPMADPGDGEIPRLYATWATDKDLFNVYSGTMGVYTVNGDPTISQYEELITGDFADDTGTVTFHGGNLYIAFPEDCHSENHNDLSLYPPSYFTIDEALPDVEECTETTYTSDRNRVTWTSPDETHLLHGCPGPFKGDDLTYLYAWSSGPEGDKLLRHDILLNTVSGPITKTEFRDLTALSLPPDFLHPDGDLCIARYTLVHDPNNFLDERQGWPTKSSVSDFKNWETCSDNTVPWTVHVKAELRKTRYRWHIPETFEGSYFKITWDVLTEPDGWNDTINDPDATPPDPLPEGTTIDEWWADHQVPKPGRPTRSYVQDLTIVWTGPGTPIPDPILDESHTVTNQAAIDAAKATWYTDWNVLNPPPEPGTRRVVNIRFICYHNSPYGEKPQVTGEGVDLTEDTPLQKRFTSKRHGINIPLTF